MLDHLGFLLDIYDFLTVDMQMFIHHAIKEFWDTALKDIIRDFLVKYLDLQQRDTINQFNATIICLSPQLWNTKPKVSVKF